MSFKCDCGREVVAVYLYYDEEGNTKKRCGECQDKARHKKSVRHPRPHNS